MMVGLGVYLPFYMSLTALLGSLAKVLYDKFGHNSDPAAFQEQGLVMASGLLGGESIIGVILAFVSVAANLLG